MEGEAATQINHLPLTNKVALLLMMVSPRHVGNLGDCYNNMQALLLDLNNINLTLIMSVMLVIFNSNVCLILTDTLHTL